MYDPDQARDATEKTWTYRLTKLGRTAIPITWTDTVTDDGTPLISGRLDHAHAADSLLVFVREGHLALAYEAGPCQQPTFDSSIPGRTTCVWRTGGVWVELWHPDRPTPAPRPTPATVAAAVKVRPLTLLRKALTPKEKSA